MLRALNILTHLKQTSDQGYSILELSIVLSIFSIFLLISLPLSHNAFEKQETAMFLNQLSCDLNLAASEARSEMVNVRFDIFHQQGFYLVTVNGIQKKRALVPNGMSITSNFPRNRLNFYPDGQISQAGTIVVKDRNGHRYNVVLQLSSGRFTVRSVDP